MISFVKKRKRAQERAMSELRERAEKELRETERELRES